MSPVLFISSLTAEFGELRRRIERLTSTNWEPSWTVSGLAGY